MEHELKVAPVLNIEGLIYSTFNFNCVLDERQYFDPSGHY